jgi:ThiF family/Prokaryotic E2 family A/Prokaryotic homologs of the JAB domain
MRPEVLTTGQRQAIAELSRIERASNNRLAVNFNSYRIDNYGRLLIDIELDCSNVMVADGGADLQERESVTLCIPGGFPFQRPGALLHNPRLATQPYVQWRRHLCLYEADADWDASDGMMGFINRLAGWFMGAARRTLGMPGEPVDPPVTYPVHDAGCVVIEPDLPEECAEAWANGSSWFGAAVLYRQNDFRINILGWESLDGRDPQHTRAFEDSLSTFQKSFGRSLFAAPVIVLPNAMTFEFPHSLGELASALAQQHNIRPTQFVEAIGRIAGINHSRATRAGAGAGQAWAASSGSPRAAHGTAPSGLYVFVGTPLRDTAGSAERQIYLAAWWLADRDANLLLRALPSLPDPAGTTGVFGELPADVRTQLSEMPLGWARVYERRPQIVERRDSGSPAGWLHQDDGRVVLIIGCGALGAPIAEQCLRGGARKLILVDNKRVTPGVLIRQPYEDRDIGRPKAQALAHRLGYAGFRSEIEARAADAMDIITADGALTGIDLIIDTSASPAVAETIELRRWTSSSPWPPVLTMRIGHLAERGFAVLALPAATGAGVDLIRKLALASHSEPELHDVADDFFPREPRVPDPGSSAATFRGSAAEVEALASFLFAGALGDLSAAAEAPGESAMSARVVRLANTAGQDSADAIAELTWAPDIVVNDPGEPGYQIRISETALTAMRDQARLTRDSEARGMEADGVLFGQIDTAARVAWVTSATGPTEDSRQSAAGFSPGMEGVRDLGDVLGASSASRLRLVGIWHTHPGGAVAQGETDQDAMHDPTQPTDAMPARSLLVIIGGTLWQWRNWLDGHGPPQISARLITRDPRADSAGPAGAA